MENITNPVQPPVMGPYPQFALLDTIVPGFSVASSLLQTHLGIDLSLYLPILLLISGSTWAWSYLYSYCSALVGEHLMSSVRIRTDDEIFNMVMAWVTQQSFARRSRNIMANTNVNSRSYSMWRFFESDDQNEEEEEDEEEDFWSRKKKTKRDVQYTPSYGSHFFWFHARPLFFNRIDNRDTSSSLSASEKEEIQISCFGRNPGILKTLLAEAREMYHEKDECKTLIYRGSTGNANTNSEPEWKRCMARSTRPFSTVILEEKTKNDLIADIADYLNPATRRWYANRGIPYRRGYLLHGPPGTGKSSLSLALAGYFKMRIYILSLSSPMSSEETVSSLFASLPRKCVVLLEDIDSAGLTHTRDKNSDTTESSNEENKTNGTATNTTTGKLSLSGLLNILDGVASQEGRVLIMTTNHIEKLDKALIRPGRVDMTVLFGRADNKMASAIFRSIYAPHEGEDIPVYDDRVADPTDEKAANREEALERIKELSHEFAAKIPEHEFSPAEIQGLLLRHKRHPLAALNATDDWIVQTRKEKEDQAAEEKKKEEEEKKKKEEEEKKKKEEEEKKKKEEEEKKKKEEEEKEKEEKKKKKKEKKKKEEEEEVSEDEDEDEEDEDEEKKKKRKKADAKKRKEKKAEPEVGDKDKKTQKESSDSGYITP
ncbi:unnamed protein product [Clonostachys rhizophaga]|uniref:Mitochondrial chaperone BCS1-B n=1 Tax=Clonostachys rhizophaga TaxID=160324 RepID=A0A9N9VTK7_9HYPO|nr:unnamed protein product [Clonostachys rhizophaga]